MAAWQRVVSLALCALLAPPLGAQGTLERVSVDPQGQQVNASSWNATSITPDGRLVGFVSNSTALVPGDVNTATHVIVFDRVSRTAELVAVSSAGVQGNGPSGSVRLSADGSRAAFDSGSDNLVPGDTNGASDVFLRDRSAGTCIRVSVDANGVQGNAGSGGPVLSSNGLCIAFTSAATNLVPNDTNGKVDIFVRDLAAGTTERVNLGAQGQANADAAYPAISGDGRFVAFESTASNLPSGNGNWMRVYLRDRQTGITTLASAALDGTPANDISYQASLSYDGNRLSFGSWASNLVPGAQGHGGQVYVRDFAAGLILRASQSNTGVAGNNSSDHAVLSPDGSAIVFYSWATDLVSADTNGSVDIYAHDLTFRTTQIVSLNARDRPMDSFATVYWAVSDGARQVAFSCNSGESVPGDTNHKSDVFVRDRGDGSPSTYCPQNATQSGCEPWLTSMGSPSASGATLFRIVALDAPTFVNHILFYGVAPAGIPFGAARLCVQPPLKRTPVETSAGAPGSCGSAFVSYFDALIASGNDPTLVAGREVYAQFWFRDGSNQKALTPAMYFTIQP